jgi:hypothetical protein
MNKVPNKYRDEEDQFVCGGGGCRNDRGKLYNFLQATNHGTKVFIARFYKYICIHMYVHACVHTT